MPPTIPPIESKKLDIFINVVMIILIIIAIIYIVLYPLVLKGIIPLINKSISIPPSVNINIQKPQKCTNFIPPSISNTANMTMLYNKYITFVNRVNSYDNSTANDAPNMSFLIDDQIDIINTQLAYMLPYSVISDEKWPSIFVSNMDNVTFIGYTLSMLTMKPLDLFTYKKRLVYITTNWKSFDSNNLLMLQTSLQLSNDFFDIIDFFITYYRTNNLLLYHFTININYSNSSIDKQRWQNMLNPISTLLQNPLIIDLINLKVFNRLQIHMNIINQTTKDYYDNHFDKFIDDFLYEETSQQFIYTPYTPLYYIYMFISQTEYILKTSYNNTFITSYNDIINTWDENYNTTFLYLQLIMDIFYSTLYSDIFYPFINSGNYKQSITNGGNYKVSTNTNIIPLCPNCTTNLTKLSQVSSQTGTPALIPDPPPSPPPQPPPPAPVVQSNNDWFNGFE